MFHRQNITYTLEQNSRYECKGKRTKLRLGYMCCRLEKGETAAIHLGYM